MSRPFVEPDPITFLTIDELYQIAERVNGTADSVADHGLLAAAVARPQATVFGEDAYPGIAAKAAAVMSSVVSNHALIDGNKRAGTLTLTTFYLINGCHLAVPTPDDLIGLVMGVAEGTMRDVAQIAALLSRWHVNGLPY
jgi:death on curing protein